MFDIINQTRLPFDDFLYFIREYPKLKTVPILHERFNLPPVKDILELAEGKSRVNEKVLREGIVVRSEDYNKSFKAISNSFLLKYQS